MKILLLFATLLTVTNLFPAEICENFSTSNIDNVSFLKSTRYQECIKKTEDILWSWNSSEEYMKVRKDLDAKGICECFKANPFNPVDILLRQDAPTDDAFEKSYRNMIFKAAKNEILDLISKASYIKELENQGLVDRDTASKVSSCSTSQFKKTVDKLSTSARSPTPTNKCSHGAFILGVDKVFGGNLTSNNEIYYGDFWSKASTSNIGNSSKKNYSFKKFLNVLGISPSSFQEFSKNTMFRTMLKRAGKDNGTKLYLDEMHGDLPAPIAHLKKNEIISASRYLADLIKSDPLMSVAFEDHNDKELWEVAKNYEGHQKLIKDKEALKTLASTIGNKCEAMKRDLKPILCDKNSPLVSPSAFFSKSFEGMKLDQLRENDDVNALLNEHYFSHAQAFEKMYCPRQFKENEKKIKGAYSKLKQRVMIQSLGMNPELELHKDSQSRRKVNYDSEGFVQVAGLGSWAKRKAKKVGTGIKKVATGTVKVATGTVKVVTSTVKVVESGLEAAAGNKDAAKKSLGEAEDDLESAAKDIGEGGELMGNAVASGVAEATGLEDERKKISKSINRASVKVEKHTIEAVGSAIELGVDVVQAHVIALEMSGKFLTLKFDDVKKKSKHLKDKGKEAGRSFGDMAESTLKVVYVIPQDMTIDMLDSTVTKGKLKKQRDRLSKEIKRETKQIGKILETTIQLENVGRVAMVYIGTSVLGPYGAALTNVLYDRYVMNNKNMSDKEMFKSFAIGAASAYAGDVFKGPGYLSRVTSKAASRLTKDIARGVFDDASPEAKDFLKTLVKSLATTDLGEDSFDLKLLERTIDNSLENVAEQGVEKKGSIDLGEVKNAMYEGAATGFTSQIVENVVQKSVVNHIPDSFLNLDQKAAEKGKKFFKELLGSHKKHESLEIQTKISDVISNASDEEKSKFSEKLEQATITLKIQAEKIAKAKFGKSARDLTNEELNSDEFRAPMSLSKDYVFENMFNTDPFITGLDKKLADHYSDGRLKSDAKPNRPMTLVELKSIAGLQSDSGTSAAGSVQLVGNIPSTRAGVGFKFGSAPAAAASLALGYVVDQYGPEIYQYVSKKSSEWANEIFSVSNGENKENSEKIASTRKKNLPAQNRKNKSNKNKDKDRWDKVKKNAERFAKAETARRSKELLRKSGDDTSKSVPKKPKNFKTPTNKPQKPIIPDGYDSGPAKGNGTVFRPKGSSGNGDTIRVMKPTKEYPNGYWVRYNKQGQPINPSTGKTGPKADTHVPLPGGH